MIENIWFTADTHFGHSNIIKYCQRPFMNKEEQALYNAAVSSNATTKEKEAWRETKLSKESVILHDEQLIKNWNRVVSEKDTVYHLGDFCFGSKSYAKDLTARLNGKICLVRGNHDKAADSIKEEFLWIKDYYELTVTDSSAPRGERFIVLLHYAMRVWNASHYGSWHLYGHSHNALPEDPAQFSFDVGVDSAARRFGGKAGTADHYRPFSYEEVKAIMEEKNWVSPISDR